MATKQQKRDPDPEKLTESSLSEAALSYLNRYDATVTQLRRVLLRRVDRYGSKADTEIVARRIEAVLSRFVESRLLDDGRYAEGFARAARLRGLSAVRIRQKLRQRGVEADLIEGVLGKLEEGDELTDLSSARAYVQKKRLLKRFDLGEPKEKQKALASLARQGFSFRIALEALGAESEGEEF